MLNSLIKYLHKTILNMFSLPAILLLFKSLIKAWKIVLTCQLFFMIEYSLYYIYTARKYHSHIAIFRVINLTCKSYLSYVSMFVPFSWYVILCVMFCIVFSRYAIVGKYNVKYKQNQKPSKVQYFYFIVYKKYIFYIKTFINWSIKI